MDEGEATLRGRRRVLASTANSATAIEWSASIIFLVILLLPAVVAHGQTEQEQTAQEQTGPGAAEPSSPAAWYGEGVRPTEARTPEQELAGFHLPPGYTVELVASEPQIAKPLNMAFDHQGRLWVSNTLEYPYPAAPDQSPRDSICVLEDRDQNGTFETVTTFADKLNIPIGLVPVDDGVIAFSIPFIWKLSDTDGDGVCDHREKLLGPFDTTRDTHGMVNAMRMGEDGWIYACHGFNNQSTVSGSDGHSITMHSGNTFRFRPDGSRVEHVSRGQVNPFGMVIDQWGNQFTADCHSKPITQLLRGGYYSSFGRPDDGLGFVPPMMDHSHGSTAISGLEILNAAATDRHPKQSAVGQSAVEQPLANQASLTFISGNVMTSRLNRNAIVRNGATFQAIEMPDFMTSDDPWFRPVDIRLGPDGAWYVADFYNKIIGHYEVPLEHPERDRFRGRIWRICSTTLPDEPAVEAADGLDPDIAQLASENQTLRAAALMRLTTRDDDGLAEDLHRNLAESPSAAIRVGCLWALQRHGRLSDAELLTALQADSPLIRVHAARVGRERESISADVLTAARRLLDDSESMVVLRAAELLGLHGDPSDVERLLSRLAAFTSPDAILRQGIRIAVRDLLQRPGIAGAIDLTPLLIDSPHADRLASILLGLPTNQAGNGLLEYLSRRTGNLHEYQPAIEHIGKHADDTAAERLIQWLQEESYAWKIRRSVWEILWKQYQDELTPSRAALRAWANQLASEKLEQVNAELDNVSLPPVPWDAPNGAAWPWQSRAAGDGENQHQYRSSFALGEQYVGTMSSQSFPAPAHLSFWIVGHDGPPSKPAKGNNLIRLILDSTGQTIAMVPAPRTDVAQNVSWDLTRWQNQSVHLECVDGDDAPAYAWIAVGRFDYLPLNAPAASSELADLLELVAVAELTEMSSQLELLASDHKLSTRSRLHLLQTLAIANGNQQAAGLATVLLHYNADPELGEMLRNARTSGDLDEAAAIIIQQTASKLTLPEQTKLASLLAAERQSLVWLIQGLRQTSLAGEVLRSTEVLHAIEILGTQSQRAEIEGRIAALPALNEKLNELKSQLVIKYQSEAHDPVAGKAVYEKHCAACHQLDGAGGLIGPQLDGAIARSVERLLEDIVTPDLNVDQAFRTSTLLLHDGTVRVGLVRNEAAAKLELVDQQGKVVSIDLDSIETRIDNAGSLMPSGLVESMSERELCDLLSYLKSKSKSK